MIDCYVTSEINHYLVKNISIASEKTHTLELRTLHGISLLFETFGGLGFERKKKLQVTKYILFQCILFKLSSFRQGRLKSS